MKTIYLYDYLSSEGFYLTQKYGTNEYHNYTQYGLLWHEGEDYGDRTDSAPKVRAVHDGVVVQDFDTIKGNYGKYVVVWDDVQMCATWYCHLESNVVKLGQRVKAGDLIGTMGATGNVTAKHLHLNFVLTDTQGKRLYNEKASNYGYLDPKAKVFPPGVPQYKVVWLKPGENMSDDTMQITKADFEKIRGNSEKWDNTVRYLEITDDPATTPFDKVKSVIAGIKSRLTDVSNQLITALSDVHNREEQVSRLKAQLLDEAKLAEQRYNNLNSVYQLAIKEKPLLEGRIEALQGQVDDLAKQKGEESTKRAQAEADLQEIKEKYNALLNDQPVKYSVSELIILLIKAITKRG